MPRVSLTTNFAHKGAHVREDTAVFQVPLLMSNKQSRFSTLETSSSVYDAFHELESSCIKRLNPSRSGASRRSLAVVATRLVKRTPQLLALIVAACAPAGDGDPGQVLQSGPMLGYATAEEALLWVQTTRPADVHFVYYDTARPDRRYRTAPVRTHRERAFTAKILADSLSPGRAYVYELYIDDRRVERHYPLLFQTPTPEDSAADPEAFRVAVGSCNYVVDPDVDASDKSYGGYQIFGHIFDLRPELMIWLGDNVYLRRGEWNSREGILRRHGHTRALPELQPLLATTHHYAIWDDHDFGPGDSDGSWRNKDLSLEAFQLFWGNPCTDETGQPGIACTFTWADVAFFLLDNRYYRTPADSAKDASILGAQQLSWLLDTLERSNATFKVVVSGGQVLNPYAAPENYSNYPEERAALLDAISARGISGVLFLSGDRHRSELSRLDRERDYPLYDATISPLTAELYDLGDEPNPLRVDGTCLVDHNFGLLEFDGPREDRRLTITAIDGRGERRWTHTIRAADLRR